MKIQIKSLHVVDCGPIKDAVIDFTDENGVPRDTTLMTGANGSGKTTMLRLIVALVQSVIHRGGSHVLALARARKVDLRLLIDGEQFVISSGSEFLKLGVGASSTSLPHEFVERIDQQSAPPITSPFYRFTSQDTSVDDFNNLVPFILYLPHHRELPSVNGQRVEREEANYQWVYEYEPRNEYQGSLNSYLIWLDYAHPDQFLAAQSVMNNLYSDGKKFEINRPRLKVIVRTRGGGTHDLEELSSGEQNILIMLIELRRRLIPGSIVLIDEIENSLHQDYQFRLGFALKALQKEVPFQLIVTSHVDTFSEILGYENTIVLPAPGTYATNPQTAAA